MDQEGLMMMNKGKRTKRSSRMALTSSDDEEDEDRRSYGSAVTEEEHDMANCLILLARGGEEKKTEDGIGVGGKRKVAEIGGGCCYECKTCNKTFASFQALGGHRTSHRKIKSEISVSGSDSDVLLSSPNCSISLQISTSAPSNKIRNDAVLANRASTLSNKTKHDSVLASRVHQCSICGSEFSSGQALGGHMRRHIAIPIRFSAPESSMTDHQSSEEVGEVKTTRSFLSLDLNLPAPEDCEISQNAATTLVCAPHSMVVGCCHY